MNLLRLCKVVGINIFILVTSIAYSGEENPYQIYQDMSIKSRAGMPWSALRQLEIVEKANDFHFQFSEQFLRKEYPITEEVLQQLYQQNQSDTIPFFTYSSMIDRTASAVKAISPEAAASQIPAIAFGIQRVFNKEMSAASVEAGWGVLRRSNDLAILNVFEKKDTTLNGVVYQLPLSDLLILSKREVGYDLIPVVVMNWQDVIDGTKNPEIFIAYTFQAPEYQGEAVRYTNANINPIPEYFNFLQKGLNLLGDDFTAMWWGSTYLADQKTLVNELPYNIIDLKTYKDNQPHKIRNQRPRFNDEDFLDRYEEIKRSLIQKLRSENLPK